MAPQEHGARYPSLNPHCRAAGPPGAVPALKAPRCQEQKLQFHRIFFSRPSGKGVNGNQGPETEHADFCGLDDRRGQSSPSKFAIGTLLTLPQPFAEYLEGAQKAQKITSAECQLN